MNLYVTDINPQKCAIALDDKTLVESLVYIAQTLCSACSHLGMWNSSMHTAIKTAHPITRWVSESKHNFRWTYHYAKALCDEYKHRCNLEHTEEKFVRSCWRAFNEHPLRPFKTEMTPFINLTPYASDALTHICYQRLLRERLFDSKSVWTKRSPPSFYMEKVA